jgi:uncharacterized membrane protein
MTPDKRAYYWKAAILAVATCLLVAKLISASDWLMALMGAK